MAKVTLNPLTPDDREQFIRENQEAFNYGALEEFGLRDDHFEEDGEIISHETIEQAIDGGEAYRIMQDGHPVGGVVIKVDGERGDLDLLFVSPRAHSKGIGYAAWCAVEQLHPEVKVWETVTPYFEKRNIHFYVGPNVTLATPMHPLLPEERNVRQDENGRYYNLEYARPITIEDNCWLASNVVVCGGVTIGEGSVIGAGSVVTRNIPPHSLAAGNPCRVVRTLSDADRMKG